MNDDIRPAPAPNYLIPFAILALSFAILMVYQIMNMSKQQTAMEETKKQLAEAITQRETMVKQSGELQAKLQALAVDLLQLSQKNEKAKTIVQKYNIQQSAPAAAATAATDAAPAKE